MILSVKKTVPMVKHKIKYCFIGNPALSSRVAFLYNNLNLIDERGNIYGRYYFI